MIRILFGPTASGKSAVALDWASKNSGAIINADALQVYDALPVLTAQPTPEDCTRVPHYLYGCQDPRTPMNAADWAGRVSKIVSEITNPIIVGGTGMYITSLLDGMAPIPPTPPEIRAQVEELYDQHGGYYVYDALEKVDPDAADAIDPNNKQRIIRAYEVWLATGEPFTAWHAKPKLMFLPAEAPVQLVVLAPDRDWVHHRAARRFETMLHANVLDEVAAFAQNVGTDNAAAQALGFKTLWAHIQGKIALDEAREDVVQDTKSYIKRQLTWGRQQMASRPTAVVATTMEEALAALT